jgi:hypothetical protein
MKLKKAVRSSHTEYHSIYSKESLPVTFTTIGSLVPEAPCRNGNPYEKYEVTYISNNGSHPLHNSSVIISHGDYWGGSNIIISNPPNTYSFTQSQFDGTLPSHADGGRIEIRTHYVNCDKGTGNEYQDRTNSNTFSSSTPASPSVIGNGNVAIVVPGSIIPIDSSVNSPTTTSTLTLPAPAPTPPPTAPPPVFKIKTQAGLCLESDQSDGTLEHGNHLQMGVCASDRNQYQQWTWGEVEDGGFYQIKNYSDPNLCLDYDGKTRRQNADRECDLPTQSGGKGGPKTVPGYSCNAYEIRRCSDGGDNKLFKYQNNKLIRKTSSDKKALSWGNSELSSKPIYQGSTWILQ